MSLYRRAELIKEISELVSTWESLDKSDFIDELLRHADDEYLEHIAKQQGIVVERG